MNINGRAEIPRSAGFFVSMAGILEAALGAGAALFLDQVLDTSSPVVGGLTPGQLVGLAMAIGGLALFLYGRRMGWHPRENSGSISRSGSNSNDDPVRRQ